MGKPTQTPAEMTIISQLDQTPDDAPERVLLELDGRRFPVAVQRRTSTPSGHTGRPLPELHTRATTSDPGTHQWLSEALKRVIERPVRVLDETNEPLGRWTISWNAYGEVGGEHRYTLILQECEELNLEALVVNGLELHPYEYREELVGGGLTIWAKMMGDEEDVLTLRRMLGGRETVPVVRRGIQSEPREMRLGVGEWAEQEERIQYRLVLVEDSVDEGAHPELAKIRRDNSRAALGFYMNFAERVVGLLIAKGLLTEDEVAEIREAASFEPVVVRHDFWRVVADIDER